MVFSWGFHLWNQILCFQHGNWSHFLPTGIRANCTSLSHSFLLIMNEKDRKSEVFSYFKKAIRECPARSHITSSNKWLLNTYYHLCANVWMLERTHSERGNRLYMCRILCMVCLGRNIGWHHWDCNRQSMKQVQNTWSIRTDLCHNTCIQMQFSKQMFSWFWSWGITKGPQALTAKPVTDFLESVFLPLTWVTFLLVTILWIVWTCDCCLFADFLMVRVLFAKTTRLIYSNKCDIFF